MLFRPSLGGISVLFRAPIGIAGSGGGTLLLYRRFLIAQGLARPRGFFLFFTRRLGNSRIVWVAG